MLTDRGSWLVRAHKLGLRCGFELETQSTNGYTWDDCGGLNEDAYNDALSSWAEDNMPSVDFSSSRQERIVREALENEARNHVDEADYYGGEPGDLFDIPSGVAVHEDGSVTGFEFVTKGAPTAAEFLRRVRAVCRMDHHVSTGCSFHIHVSLKRDEWAGMFDRELQRRLTWHLCQNRVTDLPECVQERAESGEMEKWAAPTVDNAFTIEHKRAAVSMRGAGVPTMEFRLWGNVDNYKDAKRCLELTAEALVRAVEEPAPPEFGDADLTEWLDSKTKTLAAVVEERVKTERESRINSERQAEVNKPDAYANEYLKAVGQS